MANPNSTLSSQGLNTITFTAPTTDVYSFQGTIAPPKYSTSATSGPGGGAGTGTGGGADVPSQILITINKNGTPVYTGTAGAQGFQLDGIALAAADVITIVPTSSLSQDNQPNAIRITLAITEGSL
jgi:hypothetical protein